jgi:Tol biopolymer transport system component
VRVITALAFALAAVPSGCLNSDSRTEQRPAALPRLLAQRELAFVRRTGPREEHIFVSRPDGSSMRQVERSAGCKQRPIWSPDGSRIAYRFMPKCDYTADQVVLAGAGGRERLNLSRRIGVFGNSPSWSPDGRRLAFAGIRAAGRRPDPRDRPLGLYVAAADGRRFRRLTPKRVGEVQYPMWAPDGHAIAFQVSKQEGFDIYTVAPDGSGLARLTSSEGYTEWPMWSPDSRQIAYGVEGEQAALWVMRDDGRGKHEIRSGVGVPANWAPGAWLVANCTLGRSRRIGICAVSPDGSTKRTLLGGMEAGFPAWRP